MLLSFQATSTPIGKTWLVSLLCVASSAVATPLRASTPQAVSENPTRISSGADTRALARSHLETLVVAAKARTNEAVCAAVASADQTQKSLGLDLQRKRDIIFEKSPSDSAALQRLEARCGSFHLGASSYVKAAESPTVLLCSTSHTGKKIQRRLQPITLGVRKC
jgi:hypothetical protein